MTEQSDGVTDARIQAEKVIAGILTFCREPCEGGLGASKSPDQRDGVFDAWVGGNWCEGMGRAATGRANDRAENWLGAGAKHRHEARR
jgi:hypothetical protein